MNLPTGRNGFYLSRKDLEIKLAQAAYMGAVTKPKQVAGELDPKDLHGKAMDIAEVIVSQIDTQRRTK